MRIVVSSPGSPGTSFTDNVKSQIVLMFNELQSNPNFESLSDFKNHLSRLGLNSSYVRNILPFLQYCGLIKYEGITVFENDKFFTNIGNTYVDILKCINIIEKEETEDKEELIKLLNNIQEVIYFQSLIIMMKNTNCNYALDFFDVLRFAYEYDCIDSTEYLLIQHQRNNKSLSYISDMADLINNYRNDNLQLEIKTSTKNDASGSAKSVNSFPYVNGNFEKAGVFEKKDGKFYINSNRKKEVETAINEVFEVWQHSVI